ncbi:PTS transporter subunit EIIB, partial [Streptobacillus moniliformis]|uniref:PTS transporter subunit EIIB n=1 Tax=Streptobacillus moniliformis TaxID=34105 RepID=UPI000A79F784
KDVKIIEALEKNENYDSLESCFTRLIVGVKNVNIVNINVLKEIVSLGIIFVDENNIQIVMCPKAPKI